MWKENLYQPVEVLTRRRTKFPVDEHQHSFFEMVYVRSGSGSFYVKEDECKVQRTHYKSGALFLIPPDTVHRFTVDSPCEYVFIRFTEHYAADYLGKQIEQALYASLRQCTITLDKQDTATVRSMFGHIEREKSHMRRYSNFLLRQWLNSILVIVAARLMQGTSAGYLPTETGADKAMYLLQYIQQHIHQPELLKTKALCKTFNMASTYVGQYFKRHFQEDLQHYIIRNRLKAVENMLTNTTMSVKEIAASMGYTDSCYLVRTFRSCHKMSPLEFRKLRLRQKLA